MEPIILGIESSCDETSASILQGNRVISNIITNQVIHIQYGGTVPELASRIHQCNIIPVIDQAVKKSGKLLKDLNAIAFTKGPGLFGSLIIGVSFAKSLSLSLNIPLIEVNHIQAHILCHFIYHENHKIPKFPFLCLTVSGGHTQLVLVKDYFNMKILGETLDDAAGEAFDKIGRFLGLDYPSGVIIDRLAKKGNSTKYKFSIPKLKNFSFSFSGIKTSVLYFLKKELEKDSSFVKKNLYDLCASIQFTIIKVLMEKIHQCIQATGIKRIALSGGVSANSYLRNKIISYAKKNNYEYFIPDIEFTTDNAAMIALVGFLKYKKKKFSSITSTADPNFRLELIK